MLPERVALFRLLVCPVCVLVLFTPVPVTCVPVAEFSELAPTDPLIEPVFVPAVAPVPVIGVPVAAFSCADPIELLTPVPVPVAPVPVAPVEIVPAVDERPVFVIVAGSPSVLVPVVPAVPAVPVIPVPVVPTPVDRLLALLLNEPRFAVELEPKPVVPVERSSDPTPVPLLKLEALLESEPVPVVKELAPVDMEPVPVVRELLLALTPLLEFALVPVRLPLLSQTMLPSLT